MLAISDAIIFCKQLKRGWATTLNGIIYKPEDTRLQEVIVYGVIELGKFMIKISRGMRRRTRYLRTTKGDLLWLIGFCGFVKTKERICRRIDNDEDNKIYVILNLKKKESRSVCNNFGRFKCV